MTRRSALLGTCALLLALAGGVAAGEAPALPGWEVLQYEQRGFGITARSQLTLERDSAEGGVLVLTAESAIASNSETVALRLDPASYRLRSRTRLSQGRDQRFKSWQYGPGQITRERREPGGDQTLPPGEWDLSSRIEVPYPAAAKELPVTGAYALLPLASRMLSADSPALEVIVHTDRNFYRVRMTPGTGPAVAADYRILGENRRISGRRDTRSVTLKATPEGTQRDKPDFSVLGLSGDITVLFDAGTGIPLQLRGRAPRIGSATINLQAVAMRESME